MYCDASYDAAAAAAGGRGDPHLTQLHSQTKKNDCTANLSGFSVVIPETRDLRAIASVFVSLNSGLLTAGFAAN